MYDMYHDASIILFSYFVARDTISRSNITTFLPCTSYLFSHRVAAKQLHALSGAQATESLSAEQAAEVRRDLLNEMGMLASLRHPNLLLFLGVTYDPQTHDPRSIITE